MFQDLILSGTGTCGTVRVAVGGTFTQSGGEGGSTTVNGRYSLTGGIISSPIVVGTTNIGTGTFVQTGGSILGGSSESIELGGFAGGIGIYDLSFGSITGGSEYVGYTATFIGPGYTATGIFNQTGGSNAVNFGNLFLGDNA